MGIRIKRFSRRDEKVTWSLPENAKIKILVEEGTENYKKQLKDHPDKKRIKELRKDLNNGFYYEDKPGDTYTDTHYLKDFSDLNSKNPEKRMLSYSKRINYFDRFNYFIYEPKDLGNNEYLLRIVPNSCKGHYAFGRKNYSIIKRIIQKIFNR